MANPYRELRLAVESGNTQIVTRFLDNGLPITIGHFITATEKKHYDILELFVSRGWDINTDVNHAIPSTLVYTFEDNELLQWFLSHSADPNKRCHIRDCTPLSYAVFDAPFDTIKTLFKKGGRAQNGQLLHYAAMRTREDNLEVLQFVYNQDPGYNSLYINKLLDEGTPEYLMNERTGLCTPLQYAAISGSIEMVKFLLSKGAVPDRRDPYRRTAISYAVRNGHYEIEQILKAGENAI